MLDSDSLAALDARGYVVLEALTPGLRSSASTHSRPHTFVCIDGKTYWVKGKPVQQGLVSELVAGRLAFKTGAGPNAKIIRVLSGILPSDGSANHLEGIGVGIEDFPNTVNSKDLDTFVKSGGFDPKLIDPASRALVIVFQTWLGIGDSQMLIDLTKGTVYSIDHADAFGSTNNLSDPTPIVTPIPGVDDKDIKENEHIEGAVSIIESVDDNSLLESVANIPSGEDWRSPPDRRLEICRWLAHRRDQIRKAMVTWTKTKP